MAVGVDPTRFAQLGRALSETGGRDRCYLRAADGHGRAGWSFYRSDPGSLHSRNLYGWKLHFARGHVLIALPQRLPRQQIFMLNRSGTKATSDNFDGSSTRAAGYGYAGICFLPYSN